MTAGRPMRSEYMHWAKMRQQASLTLAISGIQPIALEELGASWSDLALEPPADYGWPPLSARIAGRYGVAPECVVTAAGTSGANHLAMAAPRSAASLGEPFLITSSLTKVYGIAGLRAGWIVAPPALAARLWQLKNLFAVNDAHPAERLAFVALGRLHVFATRARAILDVNRASWNTWLAAHRDDLDALPSTVGTTAFPRVVHGDGDMLERVLRDRFDTTVVPGRFFEAPGHVRVGLCGDPPGFRAGLERLSSALESLRERRC